MEPTEVWVVFNNVQNRILHVYSEQFMAEKKANWYWYSLHAPVSGTAPNKIKIEFMTLEEAQKEIAEHAFYHGMGGDKRD